jgi:hypothetical protein
MTTTHRPDAKHGSSAGPVAAPRGLQERRFPALHALLASGLIVAGALGSSALVTAASAEGEYLAVARDLDYAAQLSHADLLMVRVDAPPGLQPVPAGEVSRVVGGYAAAPLVAGTLLTARMVTADPVPGPGEHVVGVTVPGDRLPAQRPRPGDTVLLVSTTAADPSVPGTTAAPGARSWSATVTAVSAAGGGLLQPGGGSDVVTLDVVVAVTDGPQVARAAAANQLVVIRTAGE